MCYCIRFETLKRIDFPEIQLNEDMLVSSRLDGCMLKAQNVSVKYAPPATWAIELSRRTRQEVANLIFIDYSRNTRAAKGDYNLCGVRKSEYGWNGHLLREGFSFWVRNADVQTKIGMVLFVIVQQLTKLLAKIKFHQMQKDGQRDFWHIVR